MKEFKSVIFYMSLTFICFAFICLAMDWIGFFAFLFAGVTLNIVYYLISIIIEIFKKNKDWQKVIIDSIFFLTTISFFTKYFYLRFHEILKFDDVLGFIIIPVFIIFSIQYFIKSKKQHYYDIKMNILIIVYLLLIIPLFLTYKYSPRKFIPEDWLPPSINQSNYRNENWSWWIDAKTGKGTWVKIGNVNTVKSGNYTLFFFNGKIREKGKLKQGKGVDTTFGFDINEKLVKYQIIKSDSIILYFIHDGKYQNNYPTGELMEVGFIKNHKKDKKWIGYYKNGNFKWIEYLNKGNALTMTYYGNGKMKDSSYHINNNQYGLVKFWYENGNLESCSNWENGVENGETKLYYENGQLKRCVKYVDGKVDGEMVDWYENGVLKLTGNFSNDRENGDFLFFYENGKIKTKAKFKEGEKNGDWLWYDENEKLLQKEIYKDGQLINFVTY